MADNPTKIVSLADAGKAMKRKRYADLVLKVFDDMEHVDRREQLERKAETERRARQRL